MSQVHKTYRYSVYVTGKRRKGLSAKGKQKTTNRHKNCIVYFHVYIIIKKKKRRIRQFIVFFSKKYLLLLCCFEQNVKSNAETNRRINKQINNILSIRCSTTVGCKPIGRTCRTGARVMTGRRGRRKKLPERPDG
jgi:hypothetical protein